MDESVSTAFREVRTEVKTELVETVCDFIIEHLTSGLVLEEEEGADVTGVIFYVPYADEQALARFKAYISELVPQYLPEMPPVRDKKVLDVEWQEMYRQSIQPVLIGDDILVRPPWVESRSLAHEIIVEPKMAFGTGSHATTQGCLLALRQTLQPGDRVLDLGCGSGILSILADQLKAGYIKAVDYDPVAVANCRENFELNKVRTNYEIVTGSIEACRIDPPYDCVAANIIRSTILEMLAALIELTKPSGTLILSGLLAKDEPAIANALRDLDQNEFSVNQIGDWLTFVVPRN